MRRYWRVLALGIGVYLLVLLVTWPAGRLAGYLEQQVAGLSLQGVSGTVWSGEAGALSLQGVQAGTVHWTLRPAAMLWGRLEYHVVLDGAALRGNGMIGTGPGAGVVMHDVTAELEPGFLLERFSPLSIEAAGSITVTIDTLRARNGFPDELSGRMHWTDAGLGEPVDLSLGEVDVELGSRDDSVTGTIRNAHGDIGVTGDIALLSSGRYDLRLHLTPAPSASAELVQMLDAYGQRQSDGAYLLTDSGQW